jgi:two-component system aerobic respiration control sensor histidine kinase ArcB
MKPKEDKDAIIAALRAEIKTMKSVISMMPGHVYWKNLKGEYLGCNKNFAELIIKNTNKMQSPDDLIGKTDIDLAGPEVGKKIVETDLVVIKNSRENHVEEIGLDENGFPAIYLSQKTPLLDETGNVEGILGISLDITARKNMEENLKIAKHKAEAANRVKSQFLAMVSHELRTPLTSILGFVSFLEKEDLPIKEKKRYIQHIVSSGTYLFSLINNLLDYNKLETNKYEVFAIPLDLKKLMQEVISMLSGSAKLKNISLNLQYDSNSPTYIISDGQALKQILINLLGNAIKFTEKGHVTLRVKTLNKKQNASELQIAVEDTGIGIPPDQQRSVFKRFHQLGNIYTRNTSLTGTGLGLAIVKKLVKLLGSKVDVESIPNRGSIFSFNVLFNHAEENQIEKINPVTHSIVEISDKKPRVLLIEDDTLIQIVHGQMLEDLGCSVEVAESATKALTMLQNNYDIIFSDIGLPDMSGFDLIKKIRKHYFSNQKLPVIALTGYSESEERQQCFDSGADEVAVKPISKITLKLLLERYVPKW